jgi:hypothetical protein
LESRDQNRSQASAEPTYGQFIWGDCNKNKDEKYLRISSVNIGAFPGHLKHEKLQALHDYIKFGDIDIIGLQEVNIHWKKKRATEQMAELIRLWPGRYKITTAYYMDYPSKVATQVGRVTQWATREAADRLNASGVDPTGLGRWVWQRFQGKAGRFLRVVTAYTPVIDKWDLGSVWNQQRGYWTARGIMTCLKQKFDEDLLEATDGWLEAGDHLLILMDTNGHVQHSKLAEELQKREIQELVTSRHGTGGPATFQLGSIPIDGIFGTPGLMDSRGGYMEAPGDHLGIWVDIPKEEVFGQSTSKWVPEASRRLKCDDPRVVKWYSDKLERLYADQNIKERTERLFKNKHLWLPNFVMEEWNRIDKAKTSAMLTAEKRCRKTPKGQIQWSPEYAMLTAEPKAWVLIARKRKGRRVKARYLE